MSAAMQSEVIELQPVPALFHSTDSVELSSRPCEDHAAIEPSNTLENAPSNAAQEERPLSKTQLVMTILQPSLVNFFGSFTSGIVIVGLPVIASSISLQRSLYLWPSSVYSLTTGAALLIAGSVADIVGARRVEVCSIFFLGTCILLCGFSQTGTQLVVFRALQGIGLAMHIPASVSIVASAVPAGRARNIGFGCLGLSQPLGFSFGTVISGIMIERVGWRSGFYLSGSIVLAAAAASWFTLPKPTDKPERLLMKLWKEVDWVGGAIAGGGVASLSYVFAIISAELSTIRSAATASLLTTSLVLLIAFPFWMWYRERKERSALIPNSLWKKLPFASVCALVALSYGALNSMVIFSSLYFQEIQDQPTLTASLYLLPNLLVGVCISLSVGIFVDRLEAGRLITGSLLLCSFAPLMMALADPAWKYYYMELWAQILAPMGTNVLFTVGLLIVSDNFPQKTQALAGAVFSTVSQFGTSVGVGVCQVVALGVMASNEKNNDSSSDANSTLKGYRAAFWTMFAFTASCILIALIGLRQTGKVGLKRD